MAFDDVEYVEDLRVWCGMCLHSVFQEENVVSYADRIIRQGSSDASDTIAP